MLEKQVFARTPDGHFFTTRFSGRDSKRNFLINGQPIHPRILELFVSIQHRHHLERKVTNPDFLGGTLRAEGNTFGVINLDRSYTDFEYLFRRSPRLDYPREE